MTDFDPTDLSSTDLDPTDLDPTALDKLSSGIASGKTVIQDGVISKIASLAAREVTGVHVLGGGTAARALGAIRNAISSTDLSPGISIDVGDSTVAVDISLVAEYPIDLQKVAADVRFAVISAIENLVGMRVTEVNVTVNDVHIASDDTAEPLEA